MNPNDGEQAFDPFKNLTLGNGTDSSMGSGWSCGFQTLSYLQSQVGDFEFNVFRTQYFSNHKFNPSNQAIYHFPTHLEKDLVKMPLKFIFSLAKLTKKKKIKKRKNISWNLHIDRK